MSACKFSRKKIKNSLKYLINKANRLSMKNKENSLNIVHMSSNGCHTQPSSIFVTMQLSMH